MFKRATLVCSIFASAAPSFVATQLARAWAKCALDGNTRRASMGCQGDIDGLDLYGNAETFTQLGPSAFTHSDNEAN